MTTFTSFVVMEAGSEWPAWVQACRTAPDARAVVQRDGESVEALTARVQDRLAALAARGVAPAIAVVACSERVDDATTRARSAIGRAILSTMAACGGGCVLFSAGERSHARHELSAMVALLDAEWHGSGAAVGVRFGHDARVPQESASTPRRVA